jgi:predicted permease
MGISATELLVPFAGAIQAAFSVLLTIAFGVAAAQFNLLSVSAAKEVSKLCVRMFLPALLIYKIGSNLHQETGVRYVPVLSEYTLIIEKKMKEFRPAHPLQLGPRMAL